MFVVASGNEVEFHMRTALLLQTQNKVMNEINTHATNKTFCIYVFNEFCITIIRVTTFYSHKTMLF